MSAHPSDMWLGEGGKRQSVRCCLFGRPDRQNLHDALEIQEQIQERENSCTDRFIKHWGFDPVAGLPVDGAEYVCSAVDCSKESVPEFYMKGYAPRKSKPVGRTRESWRGPYNDTVFKSLNLDTLQVQVHARRTVKRRLQLDIDDQENKQITLSSTNSSLRVPSPQPREDGRDLCGSSSPFLTVPSPSIHPCPSFLSSSNVPTIKNYTTISQWHWSTSSSAVPDMSSRKRIRGAGMPSSFLDLATPRSIDAAHNTPQRQTQMKDFFPIQKMRRSKSEI